MHTREQGYVPGYTARRICEILIERPGLTFAAVADAAELAYSSVKAHLWELQDEGFLRREGNYRGRFFWTEKPFPPSSEIAPRARHGSSEPSEVFAWWPAADQLVENSIRAMVMA